MATVRKRTIKWLALIVVLAGFGVGASAQRGGGRGMMHAGPHQADMQTFHQLFEHRAEITRQVTQLPNGVETVTESDNPEVTRILQAHVDAMVSRVKDGSAIHRRDPLFREIFQYSDRIEARVRRTAKGVHVVETSQDPYVAKLIQAHAEVVNGFIANGHAEMMKDHPVPPRE